MSLAPEPNSDRPAPLPLLRVGGLAADESALCVDGFCVIPEPAGAPAAAPPAEKAPVPGSPERR